MIDPCGGVQAVKFFRSSIRSRSILTIGSTCWRPTETMFVERPAAMQPAVLRLLASCRCGREQSKPPRLRQAATQGQVCCWRGRQATERGQFELPRRGEAIRPFAAVDGKLARSPKLGLQRPFALIRSERLAAAAGGSAVRQHGGASVENVGTLLEYF